MSGANRRRQDQPPKRYGEGLPALAYAHEEVKARPTMEQRIEALERQISELESRAKPSDTPTLPPGEMQRASNPAPQWEPKVGDWVRGRCMFTCEYKVGKYVRRAPEDRHVVDFTGNGGGWTADNLEPWRPRVGERVVHERLDRRETGYWNATVIDLLNPTHVAAHVDHVQYAKHDRHVWLIADLRPVAPQEKPALCDSKIPHSDGSESDCGLTKGPCPTCNGRGQVAPLIFGGGEYPCSACKGTGRA